MTIKQTPEERAALARDLKAWRRALCLTAAGAASRLGISPRTIEGIEQGRSTRLEWMIRAKIGVIHG